jgi:hypothetical protein
MNSIWMVRAIQAAAVVAVASFAPMAHAAFADTDGDGVPDAIDNCVLVANATQRDTQVAGVGNICNGDLNRDGFVNSLDLGIFKGVFMTSNANADFNGDGVVNSLDLGLLKGMYLKPPGPSGFEPNTSAPKNPPVATQAQVFTASQVQPDGSNGAAFYTYPTGSVTGSVLPIAGARLVPFNDLGIDPDQVAGDGTYSAYIPVDTAQLQATQQAYTSRVPANAQVFAYSGRDVTSQQAFRSGAPAGAAARPTVLASGTTLTPVTSTLPTTLAATTNSGQSLTITDTSVIADRTRTFDPCDVDATGSVGNVDGVWSFKTLMTNMANTPLTGISAQQFVHNWLLNWINAQTVNGFTIAARPNMAQFFIGWNPANPATLNMNRLPFRLLAIVNRMDLGTSSLYGVAAKAGETRFVFGLVDETSSSCAPSGGKGSAAAALRMTVIFEFGDPTLNCVGTAARANQWIHLSSDVLPSAQFNTDLQAITDTVTVVNAAPSKPNGSALDQLRTNEIVSAVPWQLREFGLTAPFSSLQSSTIKQTPDPNLFRFGSPTTALFWENNVPSILCESHSVPATTASPDAGTVNFLGSHADYGVGTFWDATTTIANQVWPACWKPNILTPAGCTSGAAVQGCPSTAGEVRHKFSINTCDDCHSGETSTQFTHVSPLTSPAQLSMFLTGAYPVGGVPDPGGELHVSRSFNDLQRRAQALESLAQGCLFLPVSFAAAQFTLTAVH